MKKEPISIIPLTACLLLLLSGTSVFAQQRTLPGRVEGVIRSYEAVLSGADDSGSRHLAYREQARVRLQPRRLARPLFPGTGVNTADSLALVALYNAAGGPAWTDNTNWLTGPVHTWTGVSLTDDGSRVTDIILIHNNLTGTLPAELGDLDSLQCLWLYRNSIGGPIPSELGSLSELIYLDLGSNQLSGTVPASLGTLTNLGYLYLDYNDLEGGVPVSFSGLSALEELSLAANRLSGPIPPELGSLNNLVFLDLCDNNFTGSIPPDIGTMSSLMLLGLCDNQLDGPIPAALSTITTLIIIDVSNNQLTGPIPAALGSMSWLMYLILADNELEGPVPPELGDAAALQALILSNNRLTGTIPAELAKGASGPPSELIANGTHRTEKAADPGTGLAYLWLNGNKLSGPVPAGLRDLFLVPDASDFTYNALYTDDPLTAAFLNTAQDGGDWQSTQTVAPLMGTPVITSPVSIQVNWTPITYQDDGGGYHVSYASDPAGPFTLFGASINKQATGQLVTGLVPETDYYFVTTARTNVHADNKNIVISDTSAMVTARTSRPNPEIEVFAAGLIPDGSSLDMGPLPAAGTAEDTLTIKNIGNYLLQLTLPVTVSGPDAADFAVTTQPGLSLLEPGDSTWFAVQFHPALSGAKTAQLTIINTDATENPYVIMLTGLAEKHSLSISADPPEGGSTDPAPGMYYHEHDERIALTALPAEGWEFRGWQGDGIDDPASLSTSVTVGGDIAVTALFRDLSGSGCAALAYHYPADSALSVPLNTTIQFLAADSGSGIDLSSLSAWINDEPIITGGNILVDSTTCISSSRHGFRVTHTPADSLPPDTATVVRVRFSNTLENPVFCDSSWSFFTESALLDTATSSSNLIGEPGGTAVNDSLGISLEIPAYALSDTVSIIISTVNELPPLPEGLQGIGLSCHFGPDGLTFTAPVTAALPYTQADLDASGITHPSELSVFYFHSSTGAWQQLTIDDVDETAMLVYCEIDAFCYLTYTAAFTAVPDRAVSLPDALLLEAPFPNPFNPETQISCRLSASGPVELLVYDLLGRKIRTLINESKPAGRFTAVWNGLDDDGRRVSTGTFIIVLKTSEGIKTQKSVLIR